MKIIALTGGIASGKSTIAKRFRELGAFVIDADQLARDAVEPGSPSLTAIAEAFGSDILREDGSLDREALARVVFSDRESLQKLNGIVHPAVSELFEKKTAEIFAANPLAVIIYEIPLLVETARSNLFDHIIVASAPEETRIKRMTALRGMEPKEASARIASQADESKRIAVADWIVDTSGSEAETLSQVDELWHLLIADQ